ncbi:hypothetical protein [Algisphaera agarilytica]|uniref:Uncharacterized protein n=1 Tax=Algisphaera agarilytica TaxID=1385975 RepID=A0A7X0LLY4_9BACT|nr:hypothetical protein [Algisphaera agarilytica]MBB6431101.1 hypothetical protein [Algisphaera agarilytica]
MQNLAAMQVLVWSDRHPLELRLLAMGRLIVEEETVFWWSANRWWPRVDDPEMAAAIGKRVVEHGRVDVIPGLLNRWSLTPPSDAEQERMEFRVFEQLMAPETVRQSLWRCVADQAHETKGSAEVARSAWVVLCRLDDESTRRAVLAQRSGTSALWTDLNAAAVLLDQLPETHEGLRWLAALRQQERYWQQLEERKDSLIEEAAAGWQIRHLGILANASEELLATDQDELQGELAREWSQVIRVPREQPVGEEVAIELGDQRTWSWPDLALVWNVMRAMDEPSVVRAWFDQADADLLDTGSEFGGVLTWKPDGSFVAVGFTPEQREGDRKFFSSPALIEAMYTGLAHYHFHAQEHHNAEYAGPGRGDLAFTANLETHTLTLTFINRDQINVDLAFPDGRVLDLGLVTRPRGGAAGQ